MKSMRLSLPLATSAIILSLLPGCDTVDNPYKVAPKLGLSADTLWGYVGVPTDTIRPTVRNNVETQEFWTFPELPAGLNIDSQTGVISGIPERAGKGEYSVKAKNGYGSSGDHVLSVRIAPGRPDKPIALSSVGSITLTWHSVPDASTYFVYRRNSDVNEFTKVIETADTSHIEGNLPNGSTWEYYLVAMADSLLSLPGDTVSRTVGSGTIGNEPPHFQTIDTVSARENEPLTVEIRVTDPDGDSVTIWSKTKPESAAFIDRENGTGVLSWTPDFGAAGSHVIEMLAWDGVNTSTIQFTISVEPVNRAPVFVDLGNKSVGEEEVLVFTFSAFDPDSQTVTLSVKPGTLPSGAEFKDNDDGSAVVTWMPGPGTTGNYEVIFVASDGIVEVEEAIVLTVGNVLRPPELSPVPDTTISENDSLHLVVRATHPDGRKILLSIENKPSNASFIDSGNGTGVLSWRPSYDDSGVYQDISVRAMLDEPDTLKDMVEFDIRVLNKDRSPMLKAVGDTTISENQNLEFTISALDPDSDPVLYSVAGMPPGADFDISTATFSWTPTYEQAGTHSVTFLATAGDLSDQESMTITVENVDRGIEFEPTEDQTVDEMEQITFTVSAVDRDGDAVTYSADDLPEGASFSPSGIFSWTPDYTQAGNYVISITASSGQNRATLDVSILVNDVNRPPVISGDPPTSAGKGNTYLFQPEVSDPDGDEVVLSFVDRPEGMELNGGIIKWEIEWLSRFKIGTNDLQVILEAKDENGGADSLIWYVDVVAHQWAGKEIGLPDGYILADVVNEDTLYAAGRCFSMNTGKLTARFGNADWSLIRTFGETTEKDPCIRSVQVRDGRIYVDLLHDGVGDGSIFSYTLDGYSERLLYEFWTGPIDTLVFGVSSKGEMAVGYGKEITSTVTSFIWAGPGGDTTYECGYNCYFTLNDGCFWGDRIVMLGEPKSFCSVDGGERWVENNVSGLRVAGDRNDGDTLFVISTDSTVLGYELGLDGYLSRIRNTGVIAKDIEMLSGNVGWIVTQNAELYFTQDSFLTKHREALPAGLEVDRIFIGSGNRPYIYAGGKVYY